MDNVNMALTSIDTDRALDAILANFSDDFIANMIQDAIGYKFRPFGVRLPNYPYLFESQFNSILTHWKGKPDRIKERREDVYLLIINSICQSYQLQLTNEISYEHLWPLCYRMYQIFISDFTELLIGFFSNYIVNHKDMIFSGLTEEQKTPKSTYGKKMYEGNLDNIILYENLEAAMEMVASLDISFENLLLQLSDQPTADMITSYISDCGDIYKNYYASYIINPFTRTDMITSIKTRFMDTTITQLKLDQNNIVSP